MEQMAEQVAGSHYQRLHHMLSESNWSRAEVRQQLIGVFAALMRDRACALVDGELFVPEHWFDDPQRCQEAGIPETLEFRTKSEMLWLCCCVCGTKDCVTAMPCSMPVTAICPGC